MLRKSKRKIWISTRSCKINFKAAFLAFSTVRQLISKDCLYCSPVFNRFLLEESQFCFSSGKASQCILAEGSSHILITFFLVTALKVTTLRH